PATGTWRRNLNPERRRSLSSLQSRFSASVGSRRMCRANSSSLRLWSRLKGMNRSCGRRAWRVKKVKQYSPHPALSRGTGRGSRRTWMRVEELEWLSPSPGERVPNAVIHGRGRRADGVKLFRWPAGKVEAREVGPPPVELFRRRRAGVDVKPVAQHQRLARLDHAVGVVRERRAHPPVVADVEERGVIRVGR